MANKTVLISIHPEYASKILSAEKRVEFRRKWSNQDVTHILIYSTAPVQRIVALAKISKVMRANPKKVWAAYKDKFPGISRKKLLDYFSGKKDAVAIELQEVMEFKNPPTLPQIFGSSFRAPQSFQYIDKKTLARIKRYKMLTKWK